jgi:hypothetical protein
LAPSMVPIARIRSALPPLPFPLCQRQLKIDCFSQL